MDKTQDTNKTPFERLRAVFVHVAAHDELSEGFSSVHVLHDAKGQICAGEDATVLAILRKWARTLTTPSAYASSFGKQIHVQGHLVDGTFFDVVGVLDGYLEGEDWDEFAASITPEAVQS